jgi:hypothetical protein
VTTVTGNYAPGGELDFSIVIDNFNYADLVGAAVESCLAQDYPANRYEIVVVDDGSTDGSREVLERYRADSRVRLHCKANGGQASAFAAAATLVRGRWVCLLDADDFYFPGKLAALARALPDDPADTFVCHEVAWKIDASGERRRGTWLAAFAGRGVLTLDDILADPLPHAYPFAIPAGQVYAAGLFRRIAPRVPEAQFRQGADNPLCWGALLLSGAVHFLQEELAAYRVHGANHFIHMVGDRPTARFDWRRRWPPMVAFLCRLAEDQADELSRRALRLAVVNHIAAAHLPPQRCSPLPAGAPQSREEIAAGLELELGMLAGRLSPGGARCDLGQSGTSYPAAVAAMEGFARPLWGLAPLLAGGGTGPAEAWRRGLVAGTDPAHPEYWGQLVDFDQRAVELAAIAAALMLAPDALWTPLSDPEQDRVAAALGQLNLVRIYDNHWLLFRVMANLALHRLGREGDRRRIAEDLDRIDSFHVGRGWYRDGPEGAVDLYTPMVFQFYGLLVSVWGADIEPERCEGFRRRAADFAPEFLAWWSADGACLAMGRSLTYRQAAAAFWGALAFAGVEIPALSWGVIKGLHLRHMRWCGEQPIRTGDGLLSVGYGYPNNNIAESYNGSASPYWAWKAMLPLALAADHPFWRAPELELPAGLATRPQPALAWLLVRDNMHDHVFALAGGQRFVPGLRHGAEKYAKFCYSSYFGLCVPTARSGLAAAAHDSMLALSEEGDYWRVRVGSTRVHLLRSAVVAEWWPWPDVRIITWLVVAGTWQVRVHRMTSSRILLSVEGAFALPPNTQQMQTLGVPRASIGLAGPDGTSAIADLLGGREAVLVKTDPNAHLRWPRTCIPTLIGRHSAGESWLACAVIGIPGTVQQQLGNHAPKLSFSDHGFTVIGPEGYPLFCAELATAFA